MENFNKKRRRKKVEKLKVNFIKKNFKWIFMVNCNDKLDLLILIWWKNDLICLLDWWKCFLSCFYKGFKYEDVVVINF